MNEQLLAALIVAIFAAAVLAFVVVALVSIVRYFQSTSRNSPTVKPQPDECTSEEESDECTSAEEDSPVQYKYQVILLFQSTLEDDLKEKLDEEISETVEWEHYPNVLQIMSVCEEVVPNNPVSVVSYPESYHLVIAHRR